MPWEKNRKHTLRHKHILVHKKNINNISVGRNVALIKISRSLRSSRPLTNRGRTKINYSRRNKWNTRCACGDSVLSRMRHECWQFLSSLDPSFIFRNYIIRKIIGIDCFWLFGSHWFRFWNFNSPVVPLYTDVPLPDSFVSRASCSNASWLLGGWTTCTRKTLRMVGGPQWTDGTHPGSRQSDTKISVN